MHMVRIGRVVAMVCGLALGGVVNAGDETVVQIPSGALQGALGGGVVSFRNIPYAAPPVDALRWRAPQAVVPWTGVRDATAFGNDCLQNRMSWDNAMSSQPTSEDCLYLNVWTPRPAANAKLPVMVWIHGGGFASGGGSSPLTIGESLAARGVVVVTFNYRLGRFGFFAHPALSAEAQGAPVGNYAFMDQIAALKWVQANIAAFGGDPRRVTIFGESAGGDSVNNLMLSEPARGLFSRAISQSGGGREHWPALHEDSGGQPSAEALGVAFARDVGLKDADAAALRALPAKKVLGDISLLDNEKKTWSGPMIDGQIITTDVAGGFAAGKQAKVPYLVGANSHELGALPGFILSGVTKELVPRLGGGADVVIGAYGSRDAFDKHFASDFNFVEPARLLATSAARSGQPTWLYRFGYIAEAKRKDLEGAPHATDVAYVFDRLDATGEKISDADRLAARQLGDIWISFATNGVPSSMVAGSDKTASWTPYAAEQDLAYEISASGVTTAPAASAGVKAITAHFAVAAPIPATAQPAAPVVQTDCDRLASATLAGGTITATHNVAPPDTIDIGLKGVPPLPVQASYCRIEATLQPTPASKVRIEVWLPPKDAWNGKYIGAGNAGYGGDFTSPYLFMGGAVARGYAAAGTDTGHAGSSMGETSDAGASWALNAPEVLTDYGHRANHVTAIAAKSLIDAYYGKPPQRSYFQGCSNGGREALQQAQRYPADYDGIVAGAPANPWSRMIAGQVWNARAAANTPGGMPDSKLALVTQAVNAQCDALDGVTDGLLENPRACRFDPTSLQCKGDDAADCLTASQVELVKAIYAGPKDQSGKQIYPGFPPGQENVQWGEWITGPASKHTFFPTEYFRYIVLGDPEWTLSKLNFDKDVALGRRKAGPILDASPDLTPFIKRGGKLIMFHGWADAAISPLGSIEYYEQMRKTVGTKRADASTRLYLAPGMAHCFGGPGPSDFNVLGALESWVEEGEAPQEIIAAKYAVDYAKLLGFPPGEPLRTRPLCPYPQTAHWSGQGSIDDAANFSCAAR